MLYSEFSAYLNWQIQYQSLTMMSQRNFLFQCCQFFFFLSIIGKKKSHKAKVPRALAKHLSSTEKFRLLKFLQGSVPFAKKSKNLQ